MPCSATALAALLFVCLHFVSTAFLDKNPALGRYQDDGKCFPFKESWYIVYRNFKYDPYYGGKSKCVKVTEVGPYVKNSTTLQVKYGNKKQKRKVRLTSAPGYNAQNVVDIHDLGSSKAKFSLTASYIDCKSCKVFRNHYAAGGKGCTLWKPASKVKQKDRCCDFVFDLLCGGLPKYQIYQRCSGSNFIGSTSTQ